jgi:hypothetical protein
MVGQGKWGKQKWGNFYICPLGCRRRQFGIMNLPPVPTCKFKLLHFLFFHPPHSLHCRWSFGVLMFEIITLGGTPYPGIQPDDMLAFLESGKRITQPDNCPNE